MDKTAIDRYDGQEIYCRKLGHHLQFSYCRMESQPLPCAAIKRCWQHRLPIDEFLDIQFTKEEIFRMEEPAAPKMTTILDIIQNMQEER